MSSLLDPTTEEIMQRFRRLARRMREHLKAMSDLYDIRPVELDTLFLLVRPMPKRALARELICDASYVTRIIKRLKARGWVEERVEEDDLRVHRLYLTPAGSAEREKIARKAQESVPLLEGLDSEERLHLLRLLRYLEEGGSESEGLLS